ncbi:MAG: glycosyltransferase family 4 protein [Burkholderiales bacterium]|nr:glycosyltransferase family 4 protein [Nitrosomonas sp.]MCP5274535.1 glycosyltransferase family 4 protein [Burkholderiales bacterium]
MPQNNTATIAYILKGFPRLTETFIANEIYLLERLGTKLILFSIKAGESGKKQAVVDKIHSPLTYLPKVSSLSGSFLPLWLIMNLRPYLLHHWKIFRARPAGYCNALKHALSLAYKHRPGRFRIRKVFIKEFVQAGFIASQIHHNPDIRLLHAHFCHGATTVTWFASLMTGLPFSFTAHAKDIYQKQLNPGDLLQQKLQAAEFVTTCTKANYHHLCALHNKPQNVHTIYHGLDVKKFAPKKLAAVDGAVPLILAVGRHVEKKGFIFLIEACEHLRTAGIQFQCEIIGESGDQTEIIRQAIDSRQLDKQVTLRQAVTQEALKNLYQRATIFVLPCIITADGDRDGIPNVMAEAMATGLPIISTPVSGIPELVAHNANGLLVPPRNGQELAHALQTLIQDAELRNKLGNAARQTICELFDSSETTLVLLQLFQQTLHAEQTA